jgi:hypothetical protein
MIGEAAEKGDYGSVETLVRWASVLGELSSEQRREPSTPGDPSTQSVSNSVAIPEAKPKAKSPKASGKRRSYPYFSKTSNNLVKTAWSKSSKSEYQHKSARIVSTKLAEVLARKGRDGNVVSMDTVLPLNLDDGSVAPDYQVYVSLAWFRQIGVVKQNGRQGYTIKVPSEIARTVDVAWSELPEAKPS